jgi:hypothetical protein
MAHFYFCPHIVQPRFYRATGCGGPLSMYLLGTVIELVLAGMLPQLGDAHI